MREMPREQGACRLKIIGKDGRKMVDLHLEMKQNIEVSDKVSCGSCHLMTLKYLLPLQHMKESGLHVSFVHLLVARAP